ncbi:MAG: hypothetical protein ACOY82_07550 [Pseudomonadota bacterium]
MREILEVGGAGFLIPAVLFVLVLYGIKGLYGLIGHRSRHRKEFLDLWDPARAQDDLWLEVIVRHHFGTTLPACIIRLALAQPDKSQSLSEVCVLWPLIRYERETQTVAWQSRRHVDLNTRRIERGAMKVAFPALALVAVGCGIVVVETGPHTISGWVYAIASLAASGWALVVVARHETITVAIEIGDDWVRRINQHRQLAGTAITK